jgi:hypothetical protein
MTFYGDMCCFMEIYAIFMEICGFLGLAGGMSPLTLSPVK